MTDSGKYFPLWQKYKPAIVSLMRAALTAPQEYQLYKHEFDAAGDRKLISYKFNIEIEKGNLLNKKASLPVSRDLLEALKSSKAAIEMMQNNNFSINLDKEFKLHILLSKGYDHVVAEEAVAAEEAVPAEEPLVDQE